MIDSRTLYVAAVALLLGAASPAFSGITVIDQSRTLSTLTHNGTQTKTATPFAPFDDSISDAFDSAEGRHERAFAQQTSSITQSSQSLHILADGHVSFDSRVNVPNVSFFNVSARSTYSFTFKVDTAADYSITETSLGNDPEGAGFTGSVLEKDGALVPGWHPNPFIGGPQKDSFSGTLAPGTYVYSGAADGHGDNDHGDVTFTTDFTVTTSAVSAVPLPKSFWMALTAIPLVVGFMWRQKHCSAV